jgi:methionyl-tRNA formyltransferase
MKNISQTALSSGKINRPIVFFGTEDFSVASLRHLLEHDYSVELVITKPDSPKGRGHKISSPAVKKLADQYNIAVRQPTRLSEIQKDIQNLKNPIGILVSYGKIIPKSILDLFPDGIINVHPSLLPKYRGPSPIESAIRNGDKSTGVSIMKLIEAMDAGPVYGYATRELHGTETRPELYAELSELGAQTLLSLLPRIISGEAVGLPQDEEQASYCKLLSKEDSWLDPSSQTAHEAERSIRAHLGFPKSKIQLNDHTLVILQAHVSETGSSLLDINFSDNTVLSIDKLIAPSGKQVTASEFLRGYSK